MLLYPIVDVDACQAKGVSPSVLAQVLGRAGVRMLQLRAKGWESQRMVALAREVQATLPATSRLIINDRVDVALGTSSYGVHVGQGDMSVPTVRKTAPGLAVGISTHSLAQVNAALRDHPDYIALGPIFATNSKHNPEPTVGVEVLRQAWASCSERQVPLVAIGGVSASNVERVRPYCSYVAVIGAITDADERVVEQTVRTFEA